MDRSRENSSQVSHAGRSANSPDATACFSPGSAATHSPGPVTPSSSSGAVHSGTLDTPDASSGEALPHGSASAPVAPRAWGRPSLPGASGVARGAEWMRGVAQGRAGTGMEAPSPLPLMPAGSAEWLQDEIVLPAVVRVDPVAGRDSGSAP